MTDASKPAESFQLILKRRLVGLLVLLLAGLALSLLLKGKPPGADAEQLQTTIVPIGGATAAEGEAENSTRR